MDVRVCTFLNVYIYNNNFCIIYYVILHIALYIVLYVVIVFKEIWTFILTFSERSKLLQIICCNILRNKLRSSKSPTSDTRYTVRMKNFSTEKDITEMEKDSIGRHWFSKSKRSRSIGITFAICLTTSSFFPPASPDRKCRRIMSKL